MCIYNYFMFNCVNSMLKVIFLYLCVTCLCFLLSIARLMFLPERQIKCRKSCVDMKQIQRITVKMLSCFYINHKMIVKCLQLKTCLAGGSCFSIISLLIFFILLMINSAFACCLGLICKWHQLI